MDFKFPKNFYWGTATSSYQVEGGIRNNWSMIGGKYDAGLACDHYNRFEEDFDLIKSMNNNAHRFSIEWARIEPEQGKFSQKEINHYKKVIQALKKRNIEPFVTLYHWTLPVWVSEKGAWLSKQSVDWFVKYVEFVVKNLPEVKFWITINEPNVYTSHSFMIGNWPPFKKGWFKSKKVLNNLAKSHNKSYKTIHQLNPESKVGIAKHNSYYKGIIRYFYVNKFWNFKFLNAIKNNQDFIGLNYYKSYSLAGDLKENPGDANDLGWGIYPKGIYFVLKDLKKYNKPIYIMENGLADAKDEKRAGFIINHLKWVHRAIKDGMDVRGYFHWSLLDNYEWARQGGFGPRFGLIEIDYKTMKRIPRSSSKVYAEICKNNGFNEAQY